MTNKISVNQIVNILQDLHKENNNLSKKALLTKLEQLYQVNSEQLVKDVEFNQQLQKAIKVFKETLLKLNSSKSLKKKTSPSSNSPDNKSSQKNLPLINNSNNHSIISNPEYWVLPNRRAFINWIDRTFLKYKSRGVIENQAQRDLFLYQKFIRDYIQINSPYRGILLFHGLGAGKTCASIAVAEAMKNHLPNKSIIIMLPASLENNYIDELMKCGSDEYKTQQHWEKIEYVTPNSQIPKDVIKKNNGVWFTNPDKSPNFSILSEKHKIEIKRQLNTIIKTKYVFIHYNGLRNSIIDNWESNGHNYFDNKVIIVDEVHNLISMIVGGGHIGKKIYQLLMKAQNIRLVFLSGTPLINYPYEAAYLFNLLRGYIFNYNLKLINQMKVSDNHLLEYLSSLSYLDYISIEPNSSISITFNSQYFQNKIINKQYQGVMKTSLKSPHKYNNNYYLELLKKDLKKLNIFIKDETLTEYTCFPEKSEDFDKYFLNRDNYQIRNPELFKRRILGTVSYYKGAKGDLLPSIVGTHIVECVMSPHQTKIYKQIRSTERDKERVARRNNKNKKNDDSKVSSYYRVFSRATCNFVFPEEIERPFPNAQSGYKDEDENEMDEANFQEDNYDVLKKRKNLKYENDKNEAFTQLSNQKDEYLNMKNISQFSTKYQKMFLNLQKSKGTSFVYSQFRSLEGIGILSLMLLANGYAEYKLVFNPNINDWEEDILPEDEDKPKFAFYTGTENNEYKEVIKKIYNNDLETLSPRLRSKIEQRGSNLNGNIIKVLFATASAAEGITLSNVRQVHITEPYWNPVRIQQVIGRAVRIKSHHGTPKWHLDSSERNVEIFIYLSVFDKQYFESDYAWMRLDNFQTSDQKVYEIAENKKKITDGLFQLMKEAAIDCGLNSLDNQNINCYSFDNVSDNAEYSFIPNIEYDNRETLKKNVQQEIKYQKIIYKGKEYYLNRTTGEIYDYQSIIEYQKNQGRKIKVGYYDNETKKAVFT